MSSTHTPPRDSQAGVDHSLTAGYAPHEHRPLASYATLTGVFGVGVGGALLALRASGRELPQQLSVGDLALLGVASHKLSRMLTKDKATSFLRAPFTRLQGNAGHAELDEEPRGVGARRAIGELLVCPYCLAQWITAAMSISLVTQPRLTRFVAGIYAELTLADFLQLAYRAAEERA